MTLAEAVSKTRAHVVQKNVGVQVDRTVLQHRADHDRRRPHGWRVAERAAGFVEQALPADRAWARMRVRLRPIGKAHHHLEFHPIGQDVKRIGEGLVERIVRSSTGHVVRFRLVRAVAARVFLGRRREDLVGDAHLDIIGLARKHRDGLVLRLPAKAGDGAVVTAAVGTPGDAKRGARRSGCRLMRQDLAILDRFDQAEAKHLQRNPERDIMLPHLLFEIRLNETARWNRGVMLDAPYGPKLMHAAVGDRIAALVANDVAVGVHLVDKPDLADRPVLQFKARYNVLFPEAVRNQIELWVFWLPSRKTLGHLNRVWNEEAARSAECRLRMTGKALIRIVAGAQSIRSEEHTS